MKDFKIFEEVRATTYYIKVWDSTSKTQLKEAPDKLVKNPDWIRVTSPEVFKKIFSLAEHYVARNIDEYAVFVHKTDPYFNKGLYKEYKQQVINLIGSEKANNVLYNVKVDLDKLTYYELTELFKNTLGLSFTINEDNEKVEMTKIKIEKKDLSKLSKDDLIKLADKYGLSTDGTKGDIKARIKEFYLLNLKFKTIEDYKKLSVEELKKIVEHKGLIPTDNKDDLIMIIKNNSVLFSL